MALQPYQENSEVSNPTKRIRWATHRASGQKGDRKRQSLIERMHKRTGSAESKSEANGDAMVTSGGETPASYNSSEVEDSGRRIFFNIPLPADARDEQGHPIAHFARNKIRTAKYTPISFIPKNLWFQFHNIANVYFLFIIILGVGATFRASKRLTDNCHYRYSPYSEPIIRP